MQCWSSARFFAAAAAAAADSQLTQLLKRLVWTQAKLSKKVKFPIVSDFTTALFDDPMDCDGDQRCLYQNSSDGADDSEDDDSNERVEE